MYLPFQWNGYAIEINISENLREILPGGFSLLA